MITEMVISFEISHQKVQPYYFKGLEGFLNIIILRLEHLGKVFDCWIPQLENPYYRV